MVSRRSGGRPIGASGTLEGEEPSVMEARRRRMGEESAGDLTVAFVTEERRVALREDSTLSSSMLRRSGDGYIRGVAALLYIIDAHLAVMCRPKVQ